MEGDRWLVVVFFLLGRDAVTCQMSFQSILSKVSSAFASKAILHSVSKFRSHTSRDFLQLVLAIG